MAAGANNATAQDTFPIEVMPQRGHANLIESVAYSPDGGFALSSSADYTLKLWELATGRELRNFSGHTDIVNSVAFSPDGRFALSGSGDRTLKLWEVATGRELRSFRGHSGYVNSVVFSGDGLFALSGSHDNTLKLWDVSTGKELRTFTGHAKFVDSVVFSPDGRFALSGSFDKTLKLWEVATGKELRTFSGHTETVSSVALSPNGALAVSGSWDNTIRLWEVATGKELRSFSGHESNVTSVSFSLDGRFILSGSWDNTLKLWEVASGKELRSFRGHTAFVSTAVFSPDGRFALSGGFDKTLKLWEVATGKELRSFSRHSGAINSVVFSPDGHFALSGCDDNTLKLWEAAKANEPRILRGHAGAVSSAAFSSDGRFVLSGSLDQTLKLWEVTTGKELRSFSGHTKAVSSVAFSPDGTFAISGSWDNTVKLWEVATGKELRSFSGHANSVYSVALSPDGNFALSAGDNTLKLWEVATGKELRSLSGHTGFVSSVAFSPDGYFALSGSSDQTLKLWEVTTGKELRSFSGHAGWVYAVAFSRDGHFALSGSWDGTLKLWDIVTGKELRSFRGHTGFVNSVSFSPDGRLALSGGQDGMMGVWDFKQDLVVAQRMGTPDGKWLAITPDGFFATSDDGLDLVLVVQGLKSYSVNQFRDQLFRDDLVRERLSGDVLGRYRDAASKINLGAILKSGAVPTIEFVSESDWAGDTIQLTVRLFNNEGGGIGKELEWRVINKDGKSALQGTTTPPELQNLSDPDGPVEVTHGLKLDPDQDNLVTVTAKNGQGRLATEPYKILVTKRLGVVTPEDSVKPQPSMFIVAIGVDGYAEPQLAKLNYPLVDVEALADAIKAVAEASGYKEAKIIKRLEQEAVRDKIKSAFDEIIAFPYQRVDTLVILLAGHGKSVDGKYYYLPFDTHFGDSRNLFTEGISSDSWKEWIAGIKVDKKLLVVDTCESSDAIAIGRGSREETARATALDRLRVSLGESVVTAARQVAYEGSFLGHGVLTYSLLEALGTPRSDGSMIDLNGLKAYLEEAVPRWSQRLSGLPQDPFIKINGNYPLGFPLAKLKPITAQSETPLSGEYFLARDVEVHSAADASASVIETLKAYTKVQVLKFDGDWTKIARQGVPRGWVSRDVVTQLLQ